MGYTLGAPKVTWRYVAVETISREELKVKMDRGDEFVLVDTMAEMYYRHSHLPTWLQNRSTSDRDGSRMAYA